MTPTKNIKLVLISFALLVTSTALWANCNNATNLKVDNISDNQAVVSWDAVAGAVRYKLAYKPSKASKWVKVIQVDTTSWSISVLLSGTVYKWAVRVDCGQAGPSDLTIGPEFNTTGPEACQAPVNLIATPLSESIARFEWNTSNGVSNYRLALRKREHGTIPWDTIIYTTDTSYVVLGLQSGTTYLWGVRTECDLLFTESEFIYGPEFQTLGQVRCADPKNLLATYLSSTTVRLSCDISAGATQYRFAIKEVGSDTWYKIVNTPENKTEISVDSNAVYQWGIRVLCANDETVSALVNAAPFSTQSSCNAPIDLTSTIRNNGDLRLTWQAIAGVAQYNIRYRMTGAADWNELNVNRNQATLKNLPSNTNFEWQVQTICETNGTMVSQFSTFAYFNSSCETPRNLRFKVKKNDQIQLQWDKVQNGSSYLVQYRLVGQGAWIEKTTNKNNLTLKNLPEGVTYEWRVQATCSSLSNFSLTVEFSTPGASIPANMAWSRNNLPVNDGTITDGSTTQLTAYPNPARDYLQLTVDGLKGKAVASLFSSSGELVLSQDLTKNQGLLDLRNLETGIYMLKVSTAKEVISQKVIVNKTVFR